MHGAIDIIGPGAVVVLALYFTLWGVSLYVVIDALRRRPTDYTGVPEGRWFFAVPQGLFFLAFALMQIPGMSRAAPWLGDGVVLALLPVFAHQIAYLLRVVFPTRARLDARMAARERALGEECADASDGFGADGEPGIATETDDSGAPSA